MTTTPEASQDEILFVTDIETTGLDDEKDCIVEIASIAVNASTLEEIGRFHTLVQPSDKARFPHPAVLRMKSQNGLWAELAEPNIPTQESAALRFRRFLGIIQPNGKITLAGDSVHFDLGFLNKMSNGFLADRLSHRVVNISTFRDTFRMWKLPWIVDDKTPGHRAMADAEKSLEKLRYAKKFLNSTRTVFIVKYPDNDDQDGFVEAVCLSLEVAERRRYEIAAERNVNVDRYFIVEHQVES